VKKKKTIIIKDPRLRRVRNNFRILLIKWKSKQWNQLNDAYTKIQFDKNHYVRKLSVKERQRVKSLRGQMNRLDWIVNHSICKCTVCSASDKDMTYNPAQERWFCVDCYQQLQQDYKGKEESVLFP